jgi:glycosyltransferase involved in cell wall biosynthesis
VNHVSLRRLSINGKFLTARPTGVHRVAAELIRQLESAHGSLDDLFQIKPVIVAPAAASQERFHGFEVSRGGVLRGQLWEQIELPRLTRPDLLLNLCNLGPIATRNAITMIHDAQVYISPASYTFAFRNWYKTILPRIGRRHLRILTVSRFSADQLASAGIADPEDISVVYNGVDHILEYPHVPEIIDRLQLRSVRFVLALSSAQAHKNIGLLLKAFSGPELADIRLVLFGSEQASDFERKGLSVPPNTMFAGRISDGELRTLLEAALCVAFPSTTEGFGLPPLEGMALGCPAVLAPRGALPEIASTAAAYASAEDPGEWVQAIRRLADDPVHRRDLSAAGLARAKEFTWKRAGTSLVDIIRSVAIEARSDGGSANGPAGRTETN